MANIQGKYIGRLTETIKAAGITIDGIRSDGSVYPANLQSAAQSIIDNFVQTDEAQLAWEQAKTPDFKNMKDNAQNVLDGNSAFLVAGNPTNNQILAQIKALTQQNNQIIKAFIQKVQ